MRQCFAGIAAVLLAAGVAAAIDPHVEGREPTPIAREFHTPDVPPVRSVTVERQKRLGEEQVRGVVLVLFFGR